MTPTLEDTCAHEAGHAAMCILLGVPVRLVDVTGDETALGRTMHEGADGDLATRMTIILGGLVESAESIHDLPAWPLDPDHGATDERRLALLAKALNLDRAGYSEIVDDALDRWESPAYKRLHAAISHALEHHGQLDAHALAQIKANAEEKDMDHVLLKAVTTTTDQGVFEAVISTESIDREKDIVSASAMVDALRQWNRPVPLAWQHSTDAADIFGAIDPEMVHEVNGEVVAGGEVDLDATSSGCRATSRRGRPGSPNGPATGSCRRSGRHWAPRCGGATRPTIQRCRRAATVSPRRARYASTPATSST
jgi:hypothetical protein